MEIFCSLLICSIYIEFLRGVKDGRLWILGCVVFFCIFMRVDLKVEDLCVFVN